MDNENNQRRFESVYSKKVRAGKRRTYFFDVRRTKGDDYYLTLTESTRRFNSDGYERHKIFLYKEDFNRFMESLEEVVDYVKTELMPDYDYDEYKRRHEEWEAKRAEEEAAGNLVGHGTEAQNETETETPTEPEIKQEAVSGNEEEEDEGVQEVNTNPKEEDMSW